MKINTYELNEIPEDQLRFSVILAKQNNKTIYVRHQDRTSYELPGGRRELGESIGQCASRELFEETGAIVFQLKPLFIYGVDNEGIETFGQVFYAEVASMTGSLEHEIEKVVLLDSLPELLTYPEIYAVIIPKAVKMIRL